MPQDTARARAHSHRVRWLFTLLDPGGLRIAEAGGQKLGQRDGAVLRAARCRWHAVLVARWWLTVHGQGGQGPAGTRDTGTDDGARALPAVAGDDGPALAQ